MRARGLLQLVSMTLMSVWLFASPLSFAQSSSPELVISQFKVTSNDGQFFMLYNASDTEIDMSKVQLVYYNHYNLNSATSSKIIKLAGKLPARSFYLINDGPLTLCYRMVINSVSLSLSSTAGHVEVQRVSQPSLGGPLVNTTEDAVSWSNKTAAPGAVTTPPTNQFMLRQPLDSTNSPSISTPGAGAWQPIIVDPANPCLYANPTITMPAPLISSNLLLLSSTPPPVTILSVISEQTGPFMPVANIGLMSPVVNELFPNPGGDLNDAEDEFIELYNPNDKPFILSGFRLEVGLTTKRTWPFPEGTVLAPKSFQAFKSEFTSVSLSNSGSAVSLLDPFGNAISTAKQYASAKDNQAWALANNEWVWTLKPTPGEANIIQAVAASPAGRKSSTSRSTEPNVKAANNGSTATDTVAAGAEPIPKVAELHPSALASVAVLAVGYGAYEYKQDITNRLRKFRADRAARRALSPKP